MASKTCPVCSRLNFAEAQQCYSCDAMLDGAAAPAPDAFRKQTASFGEEWGAAQTYELGQDEPPGARKTPLSSSVLSSGRSWLGDGDHLLTVAIMGLFLLLSFSEACEDEEEGTRGGFVYTSGGGYTSSGKSARVGSTGSRWGSGGGFGFGK